MRYKIAFIENGKFIADKNYLNFDYNTEILSVFAESVDS